MISITCTNCKTVLEIDDAFAGGVCRCQHCGTIQTVPSHLKRRAESPVSSGAPHSLPGSKTLYAGARTESGPGLDDLASVVASSGVTSSRLKKAAPPAAAPPPQVDYEQQTDQPRKSWLLPALIGGGALVAILIAVVLFLLLRSHSGTTPTATGTGEPLGPQFAGESLPGPSVVYVIDRGNATDAFFDPLKASVYRSLQLIGPEKKFAVVLTDNQTDSVTYPKEGLKDATPQELDNLKGVLADVVATGNSHFATALTDAINRHPAAIVVATGKFSLDEEDIAAFKEAQKKGVVINTIALGDTDNPTLQEASTATGGQYRQVSNHDLRNFAEPAP